MKALRIFALIFSIITALFFIGPLLRDVSLADEITTLEASGGFGNYLIEMADLPSPGRLYLALLLALLLTVGCIVGVVMAFKSSAKLAMTTYSVFGLAIVSIIIHPSFQVGFGAVSPREVALFHSVSAILTGIFLLLVSLKIKNTPKAH